MSQLKSSVPDFTHVFSDISALPRLDTEEVLPEAILNRRLVKKDDAAITQVLIKWAGLSSDPTWQLGKIITW